MKHIPIFIELLEPEDGEVMPESQLLMESVMLVNDVRNSIAARADCRSVMDDPESIETRVEFEMNRNELDHDVRPLLICAARAVADDIARHGGERPPAVEPMAPVSLYHGTGAVKWETITPDSHSILPVLTRFRMERFKIAMTGAAVELLPYQMGPALLIPDRDGQDPAGYRFHLRVLCAVTDCAGPAHRLIDGLERQYDALQNPVVARLEELIPPQHPLRRELSDLELATLPFFRVRDVAHLLGVDDGRVRRMIGRSEIATAREESAILIPRAEFLRLAVLSLVQRGENAGHAIRLLTEIREKADRAIAALAAAHR
jgi:hypothetical protein